MEELIDNTHLRKEGEWMAIWKLKIPQKVKLFIWRAARGVLPVRDNLRRRHVNCEISRAYCPDHEETVCPTFLMKLAVLTVQKHWIFGSIATSLMKFEIL